MFENKFDSLPSVTICHRTAGTLSAPHTHEDSSFSLYSVSRNKFASRIYVITASQGTRSSASLLYCASQCSWKPLTASIALALFRDKANTKSGAKWRKVMIRNRETTCPLVRRVFICHSPSSDDILDRWWPQRTSGALYRRRNLLSTSV
jgi:hypothetical protein